jgi:hypothetical protein
MTSPSTAVYPFSPAELARLGSYRAAVHAGFYTDAAPLAAHRAPAIVPSSALAPPFTRAELARLQVYRGAVAVGVYAEFGEGGGLSNS